MAEEAAQAPEQPERQMGANLKEGGHRVYSDSYRRFNRQLAGRLSSKYR
jgi:hypothetical protein